MKTWPAFQGEVDTRALDTDMVREGWPKPTVVREHETIHILCNLVDRLRSELDGELDEPTISAADPTVGTADEPGYVGLVEAVAIAAANAGVSLSADDARRLAGALTDMGAVFDAHTPETSTLPDDVWVWPVT